MYKDKRMKKQNFAGLFLIILLIAGAVAGIAAWPSVRQSIHGMDKAGWLDGRNQKIIEERFDGAVAHHDPSVSAWGKAGYVLFGEGRKGVLIGTDGWLFSTEEFARPDGFQENITRNIAAVVAVKEKLTTSKTALFIVPVPSKARVYGVHLGTYTFPAYWQAQYGRVTDSLGRHGIAHVDLMSVMGKAKQDRPLYLRTDTHWTPDGARRAAQAVAAGITASFPYLTFEPSAFRAIPGEEEDYSGDLMRYVPVGDKAADYGLIPDRLRRFAPDKEGGNDNLFDESVPSVVLVGTSYSADERWPFDLFLKESLQTDILNQAEEGQGPFTVMDNFLNSDVYKKHPPRLVIWEIPERYWPVAP